MRQIMLDTETTGLQWEKGNRVVGIGCVEILERRPSGRTFHTYLNPQCDMEPGAQAVTGLTREFLSDKPLFEAVVDDFMAFIRGAELVIHNAQFDIGFLNNELRLVAPHYGRIEDHCTVLDSLAVARERFPGQRNSLDALCKRLGVDNSHRELHGALLDAQILLEVYIALTAGQGEFELGAQTEAITQRQGDAPLPSLDGPLRVRHASPDEVAAHQAYLERLKASSGRCLWLEQEEPSA